MKLLNQSLKYLSLSILLIIGVWAIVFYFSMLNEIKDSVDEGLENYKEQIIHKARIDTTLLLHTDFKGGLFSIRKISKQQALLTKDQYTDTLITTPETHDDDWETEHVRMLSTAFRYREAYYRLKIITPTLAEEDLIDTLFWQTIGLYLVLLISIFIINNAVLKRLWKPFYNLLHQLKNYRLGSNKPLPSVRAKTKEFTDLQQAVRVLLQHNTETFEQQKQFIGNASHELQTPLAILLNKLELLLESETLKPAEADRIAEIMHLVERLIRLNKSLLLLTKIENRQFLHTQEVNLNKIVQQQVEDLAEITSFKKITVNLHETATLKVEIDDSLATVLIANLLRNALFHNIPNGKIEIEITENMLRIKNTGTPGPLSSSKIFTRFYKSNLQSTGTGLGLAIVQAISNEYHFTVAYSFVNNQHTFTLHFKK